MLFDDVVIRLWRQTYFTKEDTFQAQVRQTPIPLQGGGFQVNRSQQIESFHHVFKERVKSNQSFYNYTTSPANSNPSLEQAARDLAELGDQLYELLPHSIRDELPRLIQEVFEQGRGIRLIIEASAGDQADLLLALPWELLFFKETRIYPARSRRLLIVRRLLEVKPNRPAHLKTPFNLLHVIADDLKHPLKADLQQMERETISATIAPSHYTLIAEPGSVQKWLDTIKGFQSSDLSHREASPSQSASEPLPSQILHFLGFGSAPDLLQEQNRFAAHGYLRFVNETGQPQWVSGEQLLHLTSDTLGPQLIVLNVRDQSLLVTSHIALDLVISGFPYVVAMPAQMRQEAAKHFIRAFYRELQQERSIEEAVAAGRFEIAAQLPGAIDWCLPVLYTNVKMEEKPLLTKEVSHMESWFVGMQEALPQPDTSKKNSPMKMKDDNTEFSDVVIRLSRQTPSKDKFFAQIRQTPFPLQGGNFQIENAEQIETLLHLFTWLTTYNYYDDTAQPAKSDPSQSQMTSQLAQLTQQFVELLPRSLRDDLPRLIEEVLKSGWKVRLIIEASASNQADHLLSLPWELLFSEKVDPARSQDLLIVRRLLDAPRHSPVQMIAPFDVVHVIADDPEEPIDPGLQQVERDTIPKIVAQNNYTLVADPGSVKKLLGVMQTKPSQILHFLGHGGDPTLTENSFAARGHLYFINEMGQQEWVTGERLQHLLSGTQGLQLIVLNACNSASVVTHNVALDLVYSGFPYVVAMQARISQEAAKHFIDAFYGQLQQGQSIEYAVAASRSKIASELPGTIDWCLPLLYTNVGLAEKSLLAKMADQIVQSLFRKSNGFRQLGYFHLILGGLHLVVGLLLLASNTSQPLPDVHLIAWTTGGLLLVPPLLAMWVIKSGEYPLPANWSLSTQLALIANLLVSTSIALGILMIELFSALMLLVGLGFWALLSPLAQVLILLPLLIIAMLISYAQLRVHGQRFITDTQVEANTFDWNDLFVIAAGYIMILLPTSLLYFKASIPFTLAPPQGNLIIAAFCLVLGYLLIQEQSKE